MLTVNRTKLVSYHTNTSVHTSDGKFEIKYLVPYVFNGKKMSLGSITTQIS